MANLEVIEAVWDMNPDERQVWESQVEGLDTELVAQSVVAFQKTGKRPSAQLFVAHVRGMERKAARKPDVGPMIAAWKKQFNLTSRRISSP